MRLIGLLFLVIPLLLPLDVRAHDQAQPHFFKVDGNYIDHYPISTTSLPDFILPREVDTRAHLINQELTFEIEKKNIPLSQKNLNDSSFTLDFGDGTIQSGTSFTHSYSHTGTYLIAIRVSSVLIEKDTIINTAFIHIVPSREYQFPKPMITINNQSVSSSDIGVDLSKIVNLSGELSTSKNTIVNYLWDLGDGTSSDQLHVDHQYEIRHYGSSVLLRVKDSYGLIADAQIRLTDQNKEIQNQSLMKSRFVFSSQWISFIGLSLAFLGYLIFLFMRNRK